MDYFNYNDYIGNMGYTKYPYMNPQNMNNPYVNQIEPGNHENMGYNNYPCMNNTYSSYRSPAAANKMHPSESLKEALLLIKKAVEGEKEDELFYEVLLSQASSQKDKDIIESIIADERKHNRMFRKLYYELTGITLPKDELTETKTQKASYLENLEKALFGELSAVERYRKIMFAMPDKEKYNTLMEIMTDELKHAHKYNFLIAKNIR